MYRFDNSDNTENIGTETDETGFEINQEYAEDSEENQNNPSKKQGIFDWLDMAVAAILTVVVIFSLLFRIATIDGPSMKNTLSHGDRVIITNLFYTPKQGDIVVISRNKTNSVKDARSSDTPIIKRVIATEGQIVDIDFVKGIVSVDGVELEEDYTYTPTNLKYDINFPVVVPEGCVFVLGDNRNDSLDSRSTQIGNNGFVDTRYILGHAVLRVFPFDKIGGLS